jgi:hypothetical protein
VLRRRVGIIVRPGSPGSNVTSGVTTELRPVVATDLVSRVSLAGLNIAL